MTDSHNACHAFWSSWHKGLQTAQSQAIPRLSKQFFKTPKPYNLQLSKVSEGHFSNILFIKFRHTSRKESDVIANDQL